MKKKRESRTERLSIIYEIGGTYEELLPNVLTNFASLSFLVHKNVNPNCRKLGRRGEVAITHSQDILIPKFRMLINSTLTSSISASFELVPSYSL